MVCVKYKELTCLILIIYDLLSMFYKLINTIIICDLKIDKDPFTTEEQIDVRFHGV